MQLNLLKKTIWIVLIIAFFGYIFYSYTIDNKAKIKLTAINSHPTYTSPFQRKTAVGYTELSNGKLGLRIPNEYVVFYIPSYKFANFDERAWVKSVEENFVEETTLHVSLDDFKPTKLSEKVKVSDPNRVVIKIKSYLSKSSRTFQDYNSDVLENVKYIEKNHHCKHTEKAISHCTKAESSSYYMQISEDDILLLDCLPHGGCYSKHREADNGFFYKFSISEKDISMIDIVNEKTKEIIKSFEYDQK